LNTGRPPQPPQDLMDEHDDERWDDAYRTQLWGAVLLVRSVTPLLIERGWGRVIGIGSVSVNRPMSGHVLSTVFRAGVSGMMRHLANEVGCHGVTVNTVCPASIQTQSLSSSYDLQDRLKRIPMNRLGRPDELARVVAFLASEHAGYITGTNIHVDGGLTNAFH
jgi:3-oxoacyl-[acyl-carrier protein] reductase